MIALDSPVNREVFVAFLVAAKQHTYAAQGGAATEVPPLLPASRQMEYQDGRLLYRDVYFGSNYFAGQETVYFDTSPEWSMVYAGGVFKNVTTILGKDRVYAFLQEALLQVPDAHPYRGPLLVQKDDLVYTNEVHGDLERFWGTEAILYRGVSVYQLHYSGGVLR